MDFTIKYGRHLRLNRAKKAKSLDDRLSRAVESGDSLFVDLALLREKEVRRFSHRYIEFVKSPDGNTRWSNRGMRNGFQAHFRGRFSRCLDLERRKWLTAMVW